MDRNIIEALLDRYLSGETSSQESELVENWLQKNNNTHSHWQYFTQNEKEKWLANVFDQIQDSIKANKKKNILTSKLWLTWQNVAAVAATFVICLSVYLGWFSLQSHLNSTNFSALTVAINQQKQITLTDGSKVWVNASSQLKYPKHFSGNVREVYLSGEAYFDIQHNEKKTFVIHTGKLVTTVLGTAFNIKEDKNNHTITVTVTRGKVSVANGNKQLGVITPNQQITFSLLDNKAIQTKVDANQVIAWERTELHFDDMTFAEAAWQLQRRFDVKISFSNDKVKECRFTGTALKGEKLEEILKVICAFNNANYQKKADGSIVINGPGCK